MAIYSLAPFLGPVAGPWVFPPNPKMYHCWLLSSWTALSLGKLSGYWTLLDKTHYKLLVSSTRTLTGGGHIMFWRYGALLNSFWLWLCAQPTWLSICADFSFKKFIPETYEPTLLQRKAARYCDLLNPLLSADSPIVRLRKETGDDKYWSPLDKNTKKLSRKIIESCYVPFRKFVDFRSALVANVL